MPHILRIAEREDRGPDGPPWRRRDPLFSYPLTLPTDTAYRELEIELDASDAEVKWAKELRTKRLTAERGELEKKLEAVYREVEGLREAYGTVDDLALENEATAADGLTEALRRLRTLERQAERVDPAFRRHRERISQIEGQINRLNSQALDSPERRREYDRAHPPLALLRLPGETAMDFFDDVRTCLSLLRRELSGFFASRGVEVFHPSDLTREDFSYEFTHTELLDGEER